MKTAIYLGKQNIEIREAPMPACGLDDVVVRNVRSSVCGTDAAVWAAGPETGHKVTVGGEFGHETVSLVVEAGENVKGFEAGDRVYPYPLLARGDTSRAGTMGAFSEYMLVPHPHEGRELYHVPDSIPDETACLIEPFTVGCRAARRSQPQPGERAIVYGAGTIGIAAAMALKHFGVEGVLVVDRSALRLEKAAALGFSTCNNAECDVIDEAARLFGSARSLGGWTADVDIFIDAAGAGSILDEFTQRGKIGSRFVEVAVGVAHRDVDVLALTYGQKSIVGSGGYFPEDVRDVMDIMASGHWDIPFIVTHVFPLSRIAEALELAGHADESLNVCIDMLSEAGDAR